MENKINILKETWDENKDHLFYLYQLFLFILLYIVLGFFASPFLDMIDKMFF